MIESQRRGQGGPGKYRGFPGVIPAEGLSRGCGDKNGRDGVLARVAAWRGIGVELINEPDMERCFLESFPYGRVFAGFPIVDESPRKGPAERRVFPPDQYDPRAAAEILDFDDQVHRWSGIAVAGHRVFPDFILAETLAVFKWSPGNVQSGDTCPRARTPSSSRRYESIPIGLAYLLHNEGCIITFEEGEGP